MKQKSQDRYIESIKNSQEQRVVCCIFLIFSFIWILSFDPSLSLCPSNACAQDLPALGQMAYFRNFYGTFNKVKIKDNYGFIATSLGLMIFDIQQHLVVSFLPIGNCMDFDITEDDNGKSFMYTAKGDEGVMVFDISSTFAPNYLAEFKTPSSALNITIKGDYAFVTDKDLGLLIIDILKKDRPFVVGKCDIGKCNPDTSILDFSCFRGNVVADPNFAYVANGLRGIHIIDIKDKFYPKIVSTCDTPDLATAIMKDSNYAYVADGLSGLQIIEIRDKYHQTIVGSCSTLDAATAIALDFNYVYLGSRSSFQVVDIRDKNHPQIIANCNNIPSIINDILIVNENIYVLDKDYGLLSIDLLDKNDLRVIVPVK